jgi:tRNA (mo5U34)-methyltransferase
VSSPRRERWLAIGPLSIGLSLPFGLDRRLFGRVGSSTEILRPPADGTQPLPSRRPEASELITVDRPLRDRVGALHWYDSIDVGHGVVTPGLVDRRRHIDAYGIPDDLNGMRCLELGRGEGFWSFEMEKHGAAEVVAAGVSTEVASGGFQLAHDALGSAVARRRLNLNELTTDAVGTFDLVVIDGVLGRVHDPQRVLDKVRGISRGALHVIEAFDRSLEEYGDSCLAQYRRAYGGSWSMNTNTLKQMVAVAGFGAITEVARIFDGAETGSCEVVLRAELDQSEMSRAPSARLFQLR